MRVLLFLSLILLLASCRKEEEVKKCDCYKWEFDRDIVIEYERHQIIDSTNWIKHSAHSGYYGNDCNEDGKIIAKKIIDTHNSVNDGTAYRATQRKTMVTCK
ncbi:hypothetical protein JSO60_06660 [Riemerella anatipestifer]|uniref:hypothetical protein n=1 Tax=Riemerella anatipestifer TaxID=34085 RepID=UPI0030C38919